MNNFDKILKEKVEQFEVPYNDAHWVEMEGKLNQIRATKIKNTILSVAAGVVTLGVASYMIFSSPSNKASDLTEDTNTKIEAIVNANTIADKNISISNDNKVEKITDENNSNPIPEKDNELIVENDQDENTSVNLIKVNPDNVSDKILDNKTQHTTNSTEETKIISADFIVYNNRVCAGEEVSFESLDNDVQVSYLWNFGDGKTSNKTNPTHIYEESMDYTVTLTLIDKLTGKEYTKIEHDAVHILPQPNTYFTYLEESKKHDDNKLKYPYTLFNIKDADKENSYKWDFGNNQTSVSTSSKTIYQKSGSYVVTLITENPEGCISSIQKRVSIKDGLNLYAPTAFSPNQDGTNESFIPKALLEWDITFEMIITNKAGKSVYKTSDKNEAWNGKLNNIGQLLDEGIYFWQVLVTDAYNNKHSYQGDIQLIK